MYLIVDIMIHAFTNFILLIWFVITSTCKIMKVFYLIILSSTKLVDLKGPITSFSNVFQRLFPEFIDYFVQTLDVGFQ